MTDEERTVGAEERVRLLARALAQPAPKIAPRPDAPRWAHEVAEALPRLVEMQKRALVDLACQPHGRRVFGLDETERRMRRRA